MIIELAHAALILALVLSIWQALALPFGILARQAHFALCLRPLSLCVFLLISFAFTSLIFAYIRSDFTVLNVIENSHRLKPFWYRLTGSWGNHEGSMLLWLWVLSLYGVLAAYLSRAHHALRNGAIMVIGAITAGFTAFILITSNPFTRVFPPPSDGEGLNPLLQDMGLILHPPMLYLGYVGTAIIFAFGLSAMWQNKLDARFAKIIQPWILLCWSALTAGIGLGSWWAYRELGWGGWWFWDPVENVSLLPWLCATALLHANLVLEKRGHFTRLVGFLTILTFSMSLIGTFIVRSGLITSVHAFASAPDRGLFMLLMISLIIICGTIAFARMKIAPAPQSYALISKQGLIMLMAILLLSLAGTVLFAIIYPLLLTYFTQQTISVGAPYFEAIFVPIALILAVLAALAPLLLWDHFHLKNLRQIGGWLLGAVLLAIGVLAMLLTPDSFVTILALSLAFMLLIAMVRFARKAQFSWRNAATLIGHFGFALLLAAIAINSAFKTEIETPLRLNETQTIGEYSLTLQALKIQARHNYIAKTAQITLYQNHQFLAQLEPEMRYYPVRGQETTESAILSSWQRDIYAVIGHVRYQTNAKIALDMQASAPQDTGVNASTNADAPIGVRLYIMPAQGMIWAGFGLVMLSGLLGIFAHLRKPKNLSEKLP
jgi:cytochrome c-type biogenesis protein CcmF